ncbi:MAG: hypothetical protein NWF01_08035 [Candidatus Bathyarchaeota archaeon]|nr:hypothetical protein [Candidatus Bathyarchaeota archaeon]
MKKNVLIISTVIVAIVIILVGYYAYSYLNSTPTPELTEQEQARNDAIAYIKANHTETEQFFPSTLTWEGGEATPEGLVGSETYIYTCNGWNVTIHYPVVANPEYTITVTYTDPTATDDSHWISWEGTWQSGAITETAYTYAPPVQMQVREEVMTYIAENHAEIAEYITSSMIWTGGEIQTGGLGSTAYSYISGSWNVTITNPVVPDPIYTVSVTYPPSAASDAYMIIWVGTWQSGSITEITYAYTPQ